jgi:hypothetical protein
MVENAFCHEMEIRLSKYTVQIENENITKLLLDSDTKKMCFTQNALMEYAN